MQDMPEAAQTSQIVQTGRKILLAYWTCCAATMMKVQCLAQSVIVPSMISLIFTHFTSLYSSLLL